MVNRLIALIAHCFDNIRQRFDIKYDQVTAVALQDAFLGKIAENRATVSRVVLTRLAISPWMGMGEISSVLSSFMPA